MSKAATRHTLYLVPWHIGISGDLTYATVRLVRRLRVFLTEEPEVTRDQFRRILEIDPAGREFLPVPSRPSRRFLERIRKLLAREDVGLLSSGGVPCFVDPGGWLVRELRDAGGSVEALAGASGLTTLLSLSGYDWLDDPPTRRFSFVVYHAAQRQDSFLETLARPNEPIVVFLAVGDFGRCLETMRGRVGTRRIAVFFDLARPRRRFPYAGLVQTRTLDEWRALPKRTIDWTKVSDISLLIHPERRLGRGARGRSG